MLHKTLSPAFEATLTRAVETTAGQRQVAVFDADGTLWDRDIGEAFLRWLIAGNHLKGLDAYPDIYEEYERRVAVNRTQGYGWAVQVMKGLPLQQVETWAWQLACAWPNYRPGMKAVAEYLTSRGVEVWIVSASGELVVRQAAAFTGISKDRTCGIRTVVDANSVLTDDLVHPLTCNQGKVELIQQKIGVVPILAFGDSMGDFEMLEYSKYPMVLNLNTSPNETLLTIASQRGWTVQML
jgi:HAD superfamily phosphoserine phosphatase-like hydrolase